MNYITIYKTSLVDGVGWRVVLFVSGCSHKCPGCHNPQSWDASYGKPFTEQTKQQLFDYISSPHVDGLTISGGDPLFKANIKEVTQLCKEVSEKFPNKNIWVYTGYLYEEVKDLEIMNYINILVDGPFIKAQYDNSLNFRGSSNQRVINVKTQKEVKFKSERSDCT